MSAASMLAWKLSHAKGQSASGALRVDIKRGDDAIFGDGPYPHRITDFVGQEAAKSQLMTSMLSAATRDAPLPHTLLSSGYPGIGKTALAKLIAASLHVGYVEVGGTITLKDIQPILEAMQPRDVLFIDEIHRMVASGKRNAEWLLQLLQDGALVLPTGVVKIAPITVIAATTDAQKLPQTILDRFVIQPVLEPYTEEEAVQISQTTATRLGVDLPTVQHHRIAAAADYNPRVIGRLLMTCRDVIIGMPDCADPVNQAIAWTGFTADGLSRPAQDYLMLLPGYGGLAGQTTLKAALNESEVGQTERVLIQKGFISVTGKGRELTKLGIQRARELLADHQEDA